MKKSKIKAEIIITCHLNADFDALAAMVAASKLHPEAVLIFPGSQEKNIKNFFIQSATYLYNFKSIKDIDCAQVKKLVIVDTRQKSRVSHVQAILDNPGLEIHIYDHHPDSEEDIQGKINIIKPWGSTTAILTHIIKDKKIDLSDDEATILGLGLYEDTGCFTFNSTTEHDLLAAAWLKTKGMDLNIISDMINRDLSAEQISILNALLESATTHKINGVEIVVAEVSLDYYVGDFALLAHKLLDMENIRVLFAIGRMQDRIHVVARSRTKEVDVGRICSSLGGGGHPFAASATIKDRTPAQVKDELFALLYSQITPKNLVKDLMSSPPICTEKNKTMAQAAELMTRFGLKAVPILDEKTRKCVGILEHQLAEKAVSHGLGHVPVKEYMLREFVALGPEDDLYQVIEIILGQRQRLVPIIENEQVIGVITRTDLINILIKEPGRIPEALFSEKKRERNISSLLRDRLPKDLYNLLKLAGKLAQEMGYELFCVGGFVRDILLNQPNLDVDLVVEGDGIAFAKKLAAKLKGRVRAHQKFRTAVVILENGQRIDVATARLEYYEYPAALPTVELSSIKMDLYRRDFTINALAVHLNPDQFGKMVDFFGGQKDLKEKVIRVLHALSFVEDPTRIIRAIRFEQRFGFRIGKQTERLIKNAINLNIFPRLSGRRIFQELKMIFAENNPLACLKRMDGFGLLKAIHPLLNLTPNILKILGEIEKVLSWHKLLYLEEKVEKWLVYFLGLCSTFNDDQTKLITKRLNFSKKEEENLLGLQRQINETAAKIYKWQQGQQKLSDLYFILDPLPLEGLLYLMAKSQKDEMRKNISLFVTRLRQLPVLITGKDLKELGVEPGPVYGQILRELRAAQVDGLASDRKSQLEWLKKIINREVKPKV
ncbi:CBS domain-containing protein [Desulfohalobiaceae bacterium Ax17]|uniref:CBS domain-containing protein n=1 Tax=Desulfovulcanus ferrireducens TaxID=2831190 RepID=UPI00207BCBEA|nr:CBS domain-containing protein [Desulfovulcanus ferrireducens]MBT8763146.1 CBS domain-containing protein [Desulfovulcanus ferrireducens]